MQKQRSRPALYEILARVARPGHAHRFWAWPASSGGWSIAGVIIAVFLMLDFTPRFFLGDSISYLIASWHGWIPTERSWGFAFLAAYMLRFTHGYWSFLILQALVLFATIIASRLFFRHSPSARLAYWLAAIALALDPFLEISARFYMADLMSLSAFIFFLLGCWMLAGPNAGTRYGMALVVLGAMAAVFLRIAYIPVIELTALLLILARIGRRCALSYPALCLIAASPLSAALLLLGVNGFIYARECPHEHFLNRMSGQMLAAVYAPAIHKQDFARIGISLTTAEFTALDLTNYNKRNTQLWGNKPDDLRAFIASKIHANSSSPQVGQAEHQLVDAALRRNPLAFAIIYARTAWLYTQPREWRYHPDMAGDQPLPAAFVSYFNKHSRQAVSPILPLTKSLLMRMYLGFNGFYPLQLGLAAFSALWLLARRDCTQEVVILAAGFAAILIAAPIFSEYMVGRFVIAAVFIGYLLIGLAAASLFKRWNFAEI